MNTFQKEVLKAGAMNAASTAGGIVGLFGGLFLVGTIIDKMTNKKK